MLFQNFTLKVFSSSFGISGFRSMFLLIMLGLGSLAAMGQEIPVNAVFNPETFETGDELKLYIDYGTAEVQVEDAMQISVQVEYDGFDIVSEPTLDLTESWFCDDGNCDGTITVDHVNRIITVTLERNNSEPKSGFGHLALGKGIVIVMDELVGKKELAGGVSKVQAQRWGMEAIPSFDYSFVDKQLRFLGLGEMPEAELQVLDMNGKMILESSLLQTTMPLELESGQVYLFNLQTREGKRIQKIMVIP